MSQVTHPSHYNAGKIEVIEAIEDWKLGFHRGNAVKYTARAGKKNADKEIEDLEKAIWYLNREIELVRAKKEGREPRRPNDMNPRESSSSVTPALSSATTATPAATAGSAPTGITGNGIPGLFQDEKGNIHRDACTKGGEHSFTHYADFAYCTKCEIELPHAKSFDPPIAHGTSCRCNVCFPRAKK